MKRLLNFLWISIFLSLVFSASPASAQLFGSDEKNWEKVLIELKKINARLVSLHNKDLPTLHRNQAEMMDQVGSLRNMLPGIQGKMEELRSNQSDQMSGIQNRIGQIESFVQGEMSRQGDLQKAELSGFKKDVADKFDQLRQGMAQDMEQMATANQGQFQQMTQNNEAALTAMKLQMDKQADKTGQVIGHLSKILEANASQFQTLNTRMDSLNQMVMTNSQALNSGFVAIESNNRVVNANTDTITRVLKKGFTEQEKVQVAVATLGAEISKAQDNIKLTRDTIGLLKGIIDPKLDALTRGQATLQNGQSTVQQSVVSGQKQIADQVGAMQAGQVQITERFNKLVETTQAMLTHSGQVGEQLNQLGGKVVSGQGDMQLNNQKLGKLIDILKAMAQEQQKFDHLLNGQGKIQTSLASDQQKIDNLILGLGQVHKMASGEEQKIDNLILGFSQVHKMVSGEGQKLDQLINGQNEVRKAVIATSAQSGQVLSASLEVEKTVTGSSARMEHIMKGNQAFQEALADLRRKANVNISRNDAILKKLK